MHLSDNRYSENGVKITAPVEFPLEELDMREYSQPDQGEHRVYDLIGCVCHQGSKYFLNTFYYNWVITIPKLIGLTAVVDEPTFYGREREAIKSSSGRPFKKIPAVFFFFFFFFL